MISQEDLHLKMEETLKHDVDMVLAFRPKLITDDMWEYVVATKPELFVACQKPSFRIAMIAVSRDGFHIGNIDPINFTTDQYQKLCNAAVEQNPKAITVIPKEFKTTQLIGYAYARDPELILSEDRLTETMVESIIDHNPSLIQYVRDPDDDLIIRALEKNPKVIVYFPMISDRVRNYYEERYPQYAAMMLQGN